jgi:serine/threonine-protein kinase
MPSEASRDEPVDSRQASNQRAAALEEVLEKYLDELAEGRTPDQEEYLRAYPELADSLRGVFKTLSFVEAAGKSLNAAQLTRGQQLGEYRIVREIGRGGMGVVYQAVQTSLNRRVALKVLPAGALLSANALERFSRKPRRAAAASHEYRAGVRGGRGAGDLLLRDAVHRGALAGRASQAAAGEGYQAGA